VVFRDIEMPGSMDGLRLARAIRSRWPPIKIIATSGRYVIGEGELPSDALFLAKPFSSAQISSAYGTSRPRPRRGDAPSARW
jgi:two-component system, response regulator PdtaR